MGYICHKLLSHDVQPVLLGDVLKDHYHTGNVVPLIFVGGILHLVDTIPLLEGGFSTEGFRVCIVYVFHAKLFKVKPFRPVKILIIDLCKLLTNWVCMDYAAVLVHSYYSLGHVAEYCIQLAPFKVHLLDGVL